MRDFEELEGLDGKTEEIVIEDDEDDASFKPQQVSSLTNQEMYAEVSCTVVS
jgi:hypothetical protein